MTGQSLGSSGDSIAPGTHAATGKTTPVDADEFSLVDSAASNVLKKLTWANLKAGIKSYYDAVTSTLTNKSISLTTNTITGTKAEFNTACSDDDFLTLAGSQTVTGAKTFSTAPVINALPTGTAVASANTGSTLVARDSAGQINVFNTIPAVTSIVSSAGSTTLTTAAGVVRVTGSTTHTVVLVSSFIPAGWPLTIINDSSGTVTVNSSAGNLVQSLTGGSTVMLMVTTSTPTTAAHWKVLNVYP